MLFTEPRFLPFFALVFGVHWLLRRNGARKLWLLLASYVFYAAWDWRFLGLIALSTLVDYSAALRMERPGARRRAWLVTSLVTNLGLLGLFKYLGFFVESAAELITAFGGQPHLPTLELVLPVGISFYTFQTMSYTLDVHAGRIRATRSLLDVATFVAFFPQLVAGPIVRAREFLPQLAERRSLRRVDVRGAVVLFLVGFVKKACISDNLAPVVDAYFAAPELYDALSAWLAVLAYAAQIYCDFSGYSDMAIGCAALLGYRLVLNFDFPYLARGPQDFWRRWHISLSTWLRDYLYVPLGGGRGSRLRVHCNLMLTMLLGGLWHGAAWNFVIWGGLHGLALVVQREWHRSVPGGSVPGRVLSILSPALTLLFVCLCWIFFRAIGLQDAWSALRACALLEAGPAALGRPLLWVLPALFAVHALTRAGVLTRWWERVPGWAFAAACGLWVALALPFVSVDFTPFLYFQF